MASQPWFVAFDEENQPGLPPTHRYDGPWLQTQITLALTLGVISFLLFCWLRTRWTVLFAPRTKLRGFSPHEAHDTSSFFGWLGPTLRTSEYTVLQIVGLDAAVLLNFFKMSFWFFSVASMAALVILIPINYKHNGSWEGADDDDESDNSTFALLSPSLSRRSVSAPVVLTPLIDTLAKDHRPEWRRWLDNFSLENADAYQGVQLAFTFFFSLLALRFLYTNYRRFIRQRQIFSLELLHSIPARTVLIEQLPVHLRSDRALAEYFESMDMTVESVSCVREIGALSKLLERRTAALLKLEDAWTAYLGNPSSVDTSSLQPVPASSSRPGSPDPEAQAQAQPGRLIVPNRKRPTMRPRWWACGAKVDKIEYLTKQFVELNEAVKAKRAKARFKSTMVAFVTFADAAHTQIASQVVHNPNPGQCLTRPAPEPRDIVWENVALSPRNIRVREFIVYTIVAFILLFWSVPVTGLASLLSYKQIKRVAPWLAKMIEKYPAVRALVQTSLPSTALIAFNALLPFFLDWLSYFQGLRARSHIEYSLLKKYFLVLLITVVFVFITASTYLMAKELADAPLKIPDRLAQSLKAAKARHFFLSYVILQGVGVMPLQLLQLGIIVPRMFYMIFTRTPRDYAELNAPPQLNYGAVYPPAILVFVIGLLYSIISPLILVFSAIYFGMAYLVYKYKLLFIYYKPWESNGQAWPITYARCVWGIVIFQLFMIGLFTLQGAFLYTTLMVPLVAGTVIWSYNTHKEFKGLSKYVNLSSIYEVQRGNDPTDLIRLRSGHPVSRSQTNLNRRRYAMNDATLYVAPETDKTDYSQPPMSFWYHGVLNTGRRRYGHPALTGVLPEPWLPLKKGDTLTNPDAVPPGAGQRAKEDSAIVLTLRRRWSKVKRDARSLAENGVSAFAHNGGSSSRGSQRSRSGSDRRSASAAASVSDPNNPSNPWVDTPVPGDARARSTSFDDASGVIAVRDDHMFSDEEEYDSEEDEAREREGGEDGEDDGRVYFHHRRTPPGGFPL